MTINESILLIIGLSYMLVVLVITLWGLWSIILYILPKRPDKYLYGYCGKNNTPARKNIRTGEVEFVMWKAGEQGHATDFWCRFDPYWWDTFRINNMKDQLNG